MRIQSSIPFQDGDAFVSSLCNPLDHDDILRKLPQPLFSAELTDRLKMVSPRTWWGMIDLESKKGLLSSFEISTMTKSALGLLLPLFLLFLLRLAMVRKIQSARTLSLPRVAIPIFLSPWCLQCIHQLIFQLSMPLKSFRTLVNTPALTLSRATDVLKLRILHNRAYRTRRYDVYLPSTVRDDQAALLFIPGATVAHEAYSEVAARLSDKGFLVAIMSLEPFRLANCHFGANLASAKRIMSDIATNIDRRFLNDEFTQQLSDQGRNRTLGKTIEWTLMGHSMGAFGAMQLFRAFMDDTRGNDQTTPRVHSEHNINATTRVSGTTNIVVGKKLVLWGFAAFVDNATDLSDEKDAQILILQGTNDVFVELMRPRQGELEAFLPPNTRTEIIPGGTHEGFGSYQPSFELDGGKQKKRPISLEQQHKRACDQTTRFLLKRTIAGEQRE